jgi:short-subunit dehydrogenase involved in D-alanine esterification of teichoic acids
MIVTQFPHLNVLVNNAGIQRKVNLLVSPGFGMGCKAHTACMAGY